jgi:transcriptional regulator with XRE-family HTH domain
VSRKSPRPSASKRKSKRKSLDGTIHARLLKAREDKDLTQEQVAGELGVDATAVSHWETGQGKPSLQRVPAISRLLDIPVETLIADLMAEAEAA